MTVDSDWETQSGDSEGLKGFCWLQGTILLNWFSLCRRTFCNNLLIGSLKEVNYKSFFYDLQCGKRQYRQMYLCDEVGVRQEQLFNYVENSKNGSQLVLKSQFGSFGDGWGLLAFGAGTLDLTVNTGSTGLRVWRGEWQDCPEECWETGEESSWPVGVAEERTGRQHCVGKHPCGRLIYSVIWM